MIGQEALIGLVTAITQIDAAPSSSEALNIFRSEIERFGFRDFLIAGLPVPHDAHWDREVLCDGWSREWYLRYAREGHFAHDPCAAKSRFSFGPFLWRDLHAPRMSKRSKRVMDEATEFRMNDGICVPIRAPLSGPAVVTAASDRIEVTLETIPLIETLCVHMFRALAGLDDNAVKENAPPLTPREREVLQWTAQGKVAEDIATILGVTRNTVESHHRNIRDKLDAINIVHAVAKALRRQEIQI